MRRFYISAFLSLTVLPLPAQELLPFSESVDPFNTKFSEAPLLPELPKNVLIEHTGTIEMDLKKKAITYIGDIFIKGDNGIQIKANRAEATGETETVKLTGDTSLKQAAVTLPNDVIQPGIQLYADKTHLDAKNKTVTLNGNVSIYQGSQIHRGDHAIYHYDTRKLQTQGLASGLGPILLESDRFRMVEENGKKFFVGDNAGITTHDVSKPNFWIRSDRTTIYPEEKIVFKNMRLMAGGRQIFWLPYLAQPLDAELGYHFLPGSRSSWGAFLLNRYGIMLGGERNELTGENEDAWLLSRWHFDLRSRRGLGIGLDLVDTRTDYKGAFTGFKSYYLNDLDPSFERSSVERGFVNEDRWKYELKQRVTLAKSDQSSTELKFNITVLSDRFFLEDFEEDTFRINPNPDNEVGVYHSSSNYLAGVQARFRPNDFHQTDTRLPEVFLDIVKQPILNSGFLYESQTSWAIFREQLADFSENSLIAEAATLSLGDSRLNTINELLDDRGYNRFHTWHEFSKPFKVGKFLALNPHIGAGFTHYSSIDNGLESFNRSHFALGIDASTKISKAYPDLVNKKWGIDGLLHTIQPYVNFSELTTNELDSDFRGIETLISSTRPRPLEVGRFTAIDDLSDWSIVRLGVRNNLLTKRNDDTHNWLTTNTYIDAFFNDPEFTRDFSNLYNDVIWQPLPWMRLSFETQFPILSGGSDFREFSGNFRFMPTDSWEFEIGYRELDNHPTLQDSSSLRLKTYKRISDSWGIGTTHRWELDDNTFEIQEYNIYHNFDSWTASAGIFAYDHRNRKEFGVLLNFTLREFPAFNLPLTGGVN